VEDFVAVGLSTQHTAPSVTFLQTIRDVVLPAATMVQKKLERQLRRDHNAYLAREQAAAYAAAYAAGINPYLSSRSARSSRTQVNYRELDEGDIGAMLDIDDAVVSGRAASKRAHHLSAAHTPAPASTAQVQPAASGRTTLASARAAAAAAELAAVGLGDGSATAAAASAAEWIHDHEADDEHDEQQRANKRRRPASGDASSIAPTLPNAAATAAPAVDSPPRDSAPSTVPAAAVDPASAVLPAPTPDSSTSALPLAASPLVDAAPPAEHIVESSAAPSVPSAIVASDSAALSPNGMQS
jgi:hypothetical protein